MTSPEVMSALYLSLTVGVWCALLGLLPAVALGWLLARKQFPGKAVLGALVLAPMVLPPVVTGLLLLRLMGTQGPLGPLLAEVGIRVPFSFLGAVLAALLVGLPLYVLVVRSAFEAADPRYEEVSLTLGVPPRRTFWRITLPLALPGIAAGAVLAFARALGEFGATIVLAGNVPGETRTLALAVYSLLDAPGGEDSLLPLLGCSISLSAVALGAYEFLIRRLRQRLEVDGGR